MVKTCVSSIPLSKERKNTLHRGMVIIPALDKAHRAIRSTSQHKKLNGIIGQISELKKPNVAFHTRKVRKVMA
jgi:hypothetical protein